MALTEKEIADIRQKTTFEIPATAEAHAEVMSRTMWKPKPFTIPKRTATSGCYQVTLFRAHTILSNYAKGEQEDIKQRLADHYKIWQQLNNLTKSVRALINKGDYRGLTPVNKEARRARELIEKEIIKTNELCPPIMKSIPQSMFDLVLDNWHLITSKNFKIN